MFVFQLKSPDGTKVKPLDGEQPGMKANRVNQAIKMDCANVVDTIDIEDMDEMVAFCRFRSLFYFHPLYK